MTYLTTDRWLAQLLQIRHGERFLLSALPIYRAQKEDTLACAKIQIAFDDWIRQTKSQFVIRQGHDYTRTTQ